MFAQDIKRSIISNIGATFPDSDKRLSIWAETDKYHWKEDESVWNQKKGKTAPQYESHFDGEFVCFLDESKGTNYNVIEFLNNFKRLYKEGKIFVHKEMYEVVSAQKQADNTVVVPKATSEADEMIIKVVEKHAKKRGKKVVQK